MSLNRNFTDFLRDFAIFALMLSHLLRSYNREICWEIELGGVGEEYLVYKVRVRNSNIQKGKSAGYRLIYQVESPTSILLLTIYSKSDREDITTNEIIDIVANFDREES
jgi:mRNA-degrading endonuclease RelE of RelBE toxin-antitoxin system